MASLPLSGAPLPLCGSLLCVPSRRGGLALLPLASQEDAAAPRSSASVELGDGWTVDASAASPSGRLLAVAARCSSDDASCHVFVYDTSSPASAPTLLRRLDSPSLSFSLLAFSHSLSSPLLLGVCTEGRPHARLWDLSEGRCAAVSYAAAAEGVTAARFREGHLQFATVTDARATVWEVREGEIVPRYTVGAATQDNAGRRFLCVAFTPGGRLLLGASTSEVVECAVPEEDGGEPDDRGGGGGGGGGGGDAVPAEELERGHVAELPARVHDLGALEEVVALLPTREHVVLATAGAQLHWLDAQTFEPLYSDFVYDPVYEELEAAGELPDAPEPELEWIGFDADYGALTALTSDGVVLRVEFTATPAEFRRALDPAAAADEGTAAVPHAAGLERRRVSVVSAGHGHGRRGSAFSNATDGGDLAIFQVRRAGCPLLVRGPGDEEEAARKEAPAAAEEEQLPAEPDSAEAVAGVCAAASASTHARRASATSSVSGEPVSERAREILTGVEALRARFDALRRRNETAPDMERVGEDEVLVNLDLREQLKRDADFRASAARATVERENLGRHLVVARIREECWDSAEEQQRAFRAIGRDLEVWNFAVRRRTPAEERRLRRVRFLRLMETHEQRWTGLLRPAGASPDHEAGGEAAVAAMLDHCAERVANMYGGADHEEGKAVAASAASVARVGAGLGHRGASEALADLRPLLRQPQLCLTAVRKGTQVLLLTECVRRLKRAFNRAFEAVADQKSEAADKVAEKAARIAKIEQEIGAGRAVPSCGEGPNERPEAVFEVLPDELTTCPVELPEERAEREAREAAARDAAADRDVEAARRALDDMMGGTLESKRDEAALERELVREPWMDETPPERMTDSQRTALAAFEKKVQTLLEAREARRRLLETELGKLHNDVAEVVRKFDARLAALAEYRVAMQRHLCEHTLVAAKLAGDLAHFEHCGREMRRIEASHGEVAAMHARAGADLERCEAAAAEREAAHQAAAAEERATERAAKLALRELGASWDRLGRIYRARVRAVAASSKGGAGGSGGGARAASGSAKKGGKRSRSAKARAKSAKKRATAAKAAADAAVHSCVAADGDDGDAAAAAAPRVADLLRPAEVEGADEAAARAAAADAAVEDEALRTVSRPDDVTGEAWQVFLDCKARHLERQRELREAGAELERHRAVLRRALAREERLRARVDELGLLWHRTAEERRHALVNTDLLVELPQGQVELSEAPVVNELRDALLMDRTSVEELNEQVRELGGGVVDVLRTMTGERRLIKRQRWETRLRDLELADAADLTTELQLLRVTKDIQSLIKLGGQGVQAAAEVTQLERQAAYMEEANSERADMYSAQANALRKRSRALVRENAQLAAAADELEACLRSRLGISKMRAREAEAGAAAREQRMESLVERRRLNELHALQQQELRVLRESVVSLRRRTFASFAPPGRGIEGRLPVEGAAPPPAPATRSRASSAAASRRARSRGARVHGYRPPSSAAGRARACTHQQFRGSGSRQSSARPEPYEQTQSSLSHRRPGAAALSPSPPPFAAAAGAQLAVDARGEAKPSAGRPRPRSGTMRRPPLSARRPVSAAAVGARREPKRDRDGAWLPAVDARRAEGSARSSSSSSSAAAAKTATPRVQSAGPVPKRA